MTHNNDGGKAPEDRLAELTDEQRIKAFTLGVALMAAMPALEHRTDVRHDVDTIVGGWRQYAGDVVEAVTEERFNGTPDETDAWYLESFGRVSEDFGGSGSNVAPLDPVWKLAAERAGFRFGSDGRTEWNDFMHDFNEATRMAVTPVEKRNLYGKTLSALRDTPLRHNPSAWTTFGVCARRLNFPGFDPDVHDVEVEERYEAACERHERIQSFSKLADPVDDPVLTYADPSTLQDAVNAMGTSAKEYMRGVLDVVIPGGTPAGHDDDASAAFAAWCHSVMKGDGADGRP